MHWCTITWYQHDRWGPSTVNLSTVFNIFNQWVLDMWCHEVYETVRSLRQRRGDRLGAVQRKLPPVQRLGLHFSRCCQLFCDSGRKLSLLNHSLRNLSRGRCCIPFVLACSRASMINAAQRRSININQNHFPLFFMAEAPVQDMQDPPWKTEDGLALCAGRLQLDEFASFGFGEAELDIVGFRERPSKNTRFITFYEFLWYEAILLYGRRKSRGSSSCLCTSFSSSPQLYYTERCFKQATTVMNIFITVVACLKHLSV